MVVAGLIKYYEKNPDAKQGPSYKALTKKYLFGMVMPGLLLSLGSGLFQVIYRGVPFYMSQGWFHAKLTLVLILFIATYLAWQGVQSVQKGEVVSAKKYGIVHIVVSSVFLVIVLVTFLGKI